MASHDADNYAKTTSVPPKAIDGGDYGGRVRVCYDQVDTSSGFASADTVNVGLLMPGERVVGITAGFSAHGASRTLTIGDAADADRFLASTDISAAGVTSAIAAAGFGYKNATGSAIPIVATIGGGALGTGTPGLRVALFTVRD